MNPYIKLCEDTLDGYLQRVSKHRAALRDVNSFDDPGETQRIRSEFSASLAATTALRVLLEKMRRVPLDWEVDEIPGSNDFKVRHLDADGEPIAIDAASLGQYDPTKTDTPDRRQTVLEEASDTEAVYRQDTYGDPEDSWFTVAEFWNTYLERAGILSDMAAGLNASQAATMMLLLKVARLAAMPGHRDSLVDVAGYARAVERIEEAYQRRSQKLAHATVGGAAFTITEADRPE